jgi:hypothetical protein
MMPWPAYLNTFRASSEAAVTALGDVASHFAVAEQVPILIAEGCKDNVGPKTFAILTDAPAFVFDEALARGRLEFELGLARGDVFRCLEFRDAG